MIVLFTCFFPSIHTSPFSLEPYHVKIRYIFPLPICKYTALRGTNITGYICFSSYPQLNSVHCVYTATKPMCGIPDIAVPGLLWYKRHSLDIPAYTCSSCKRNDILRSRFKVLVWYVSMQFDGYVISTI